MKLLALTLLLTGCLLTTGCLSTSNSPHRWSTSEHIEMMGECKALCDGSVRQYRPITGDCTCRDVLRSSKK